MKKIWVVILRLFFFENTPFTLCKAAEAGKYLPEKNKIKNNEKSVLLTMVGGLQQNSCSNANLCGNSSVKKQAGAKLGQSKICLTNT